MSDLMVPADGEIPLDAPPDPPAPTSDDDDYLVPL